MTATPETLTVNGVEYTRRPDAGALPYVIVRTDTAGVHAGLLVSRDGGEVTLTAARRLWYWKGAASLSQLAEEGVSAPAECKFSVPVGEIVLLRACEILTCTPAAIASIAKVKEWRA